MDEAAHARDMAERVLRDKLNATVPTTLRSQRHYANSSVHVYDAGAHTVVVKVGRDWPEGGASRLLADANALDDRLQQHAPATNVRTPRVYAASDVPPLLCMAYVDGEDADGVFISALKRRDGASLSRADQMVRHLGEALAAFHVSERDANSADVVQAGERTTARLLRRLGIGRRHRARLGALRNVSRAFCDVGMHNLRIANTGTRFLIDLPSAHLALPVYFDIAQALAWFEDAYRDAPLIHRRNLRRRFTPGFLDAYRNVSPEALASAEDMHTLQLFVAAAELGWVKTAVRRRHHGQAVLTAGRFARHLFAIHRPGPKRPAWADPDLQ